MKNGNSVTRAINKITRSWQIRSFEMNSVAEFGIAAHWKYKDSNEKDNASALDQWITKVRESLEQNDISAIEFVDDFNATDALNNQVFPNL